MMRTLVLSFAGFIMCFLSASAQRPLVLVELNCENLFDCRHDSLKDDAEFLPDGPRHWTPARYWHKLNMLGKELLSVADELPDLIALVEVENDSVMHDLTRRSLLRNARYEYLMTESPDVRGLDVALLYQPASFRPLCYECITIVPEKDMRPTRDILYVKGRTHQGDTLHLYVVHAPSRYGGAKASEPYRLKVATTLSQHIATLAEDSHIIVIGDFNDYSTSRSLSMLEQQGLVNVSRDARGHGPARGTYRFEGQWQSIDHCLASLLMAERVSEVYVHDAPFLLEADVHWGGYKPFRTFMGFRNNHGFSDHLPLVVKIRKTEE